MTSGELSKLLDELAAADEEMAESVSEQEKTTQESADVELEDLAITSSHSPLQESFVPEFSEPEVTDQVASPFTESGESGESDGQLSQEKRPRFASRISTSSLANLLHQVSPKMGDATAIGEFAELTEENLSAVRYHLNSCKVIIISLICSQRVSSLKIRIQKTTTM
jgi:hypothetical protein